MLRTLSSAPIGPALLSCAVAVASLVAPPAADACSGPAGCWGRIAPAMDEAVPSNAPALMVSDIPAEDWSGGVTVHRADASPVSITYESRGYSLLLRPQSPWLVGERYRSMCSTGPGSGATLPSLRWPQRSFREELRASRSRRPGTGMWRWGMVRPAPRPSMRRGPRFGSSRERSRRGCRLRHESCGWTGLRGRGRR
jgi:hypothetical protein